ncbi:fasciclin domain-containing protein [Pontibacter roseus]|uniref:fasciclin domain-containing protein n=1 Tax=Pontibacter roseus TaxID=336989 RepID=UPI001FE01133|nr:fasciclin domain-containing protein [Pontibacter roseus]
MKLRMLKPFVAVLAAGFMYGCASTGETTDTTAADDTSTMSETQTMAGDDMATDTASTTDVTTNTDAMSTEVTSDMETSSMSILDAAATRSEISTFLELIETAKVAKALQGQGEFTIFAPTNEAFENLPAGQLDYLKKPENRNELLKVLQAHMIATKVTTAQLQNNQRIQVGENDYIDVSVGDSMNNVTIGGASVVEADIEAANGVIHIVDKVLVTADRVQDQK